MSGALTFGASGPIALGEFVFQGFEVPESVRWGGQQRLVVHKLIGGTRIIDAMGRDDADVSWSGILLSADASERADELDQIRVAGLPVQLLFSGRSYLVAVRAFEADQRKINHVPYRIACTVLQDESTGGFIAEPTPFGAITLDIGVVAAEAPPPSLVTVQATLAPTVATLATMQTLEAGTAAANAAMAAVAAAQTQALAVRAASDAALTPLAAQADAGVVLGVTGDADATLAAMDAATAGILDGAEAATMAAYLGRAQANLAGL